MFPELKSLLGQKRMKLNCYDGATDKDRKESYNSNEDCHERGKGSRYNFTLKLLKFPSVTSFWRKCDQRMKLFQIFHVVINDF